MLLEAALDQLSQFVAATPRPRIEGLLRRLKGGQSLSAAILLESVTGRDLTNFLQFAEHPQFEGHSPLLAELLEAEYRRRAALAPLPRVVWTGPRIDPTLEYVRTSVAVRQLVSAARRRILIAGYRVTGDTLLQAGVWSAIERGVSVSMLVDGNELKNDDRQIFMAKGIDLHSIASANHDYTKFHAKVIVGDGNRALIGSANFTLLGHSANVELGILIEGAAASTIESLLASYLQTARSSGWIISK